MSPSVLRQYTPPTCTLEIAAKESPLSRWTDRSVLKQLRFQLSFDDPRLLAEQQVRVTGDRLQLDALVDAVETYVQILLDAAPMQLGHAFEQQPPPDANGSASLPPVPAVQDRDGFHSLSLPTALVLQHQEPLLAHPHGIFLESRGLLSHILHLGTLAPSDERETVALSTLQLFDLANALDDYKADALALPILNRPAWAQSRRGWLQVAAIALVAIGITSVVGKFVMDVSTPQMQTASNQGAAEGNPSTSLAPTESAPSGISPAEPFPQINPLPPPPPLGTTKQPTTPLPPVGVPRTVTPGTNPPPPTRIPPLPSLSTIPRQTVPSAPAGANQGRSQLQIPPQPASPNMATIPPSARAGGEARSSGDDLAFEANPRLGATADQAQSAPPLSSGAAANSIPQVAEVRQYFQQTWQPPEALNRPVEYRLLLGADGTIQQILPLGNAAGDYIDRTGMPLVGDPFVSPIASGKSALIRLVLNPDGTVQTFLEAGE